jgi:DNA recombination protein RmuC
MQSLFTTILITSLIAGFTIFFIIYYLNKLKTDLKQEESTVLMAWLKDMKFSIDKNTDTLDKQLKDQRSSIEQQLNNQRTSLNEQTKAIGERLDKAYEVIGNVQKQMGGIQEFGSDIKDLSNILKSPKLRGGLGETFLYEIIGNILPSDLYRTQYKFKDGSVCDTVIFIDKGIIPIDSKFPMENFKAMVTAETQELRDKFRKSFISDVKKRIDEIAVKYIIPEEGTTEQALMYIPSENVYYELIVNTPEIEDYAKYRSVLMVSPNNISYFLKVLLVAYQRQELQKHAGDILKAIAGIKIEAEKFNEDLNLLERHLTNSYKTMDTVKIKYLKLFGKIDRAQALGDDKEQPLLLEQDKEL